MSSLLRFLEEPAKPKETPTETAPPAEEAAARAFGEPPEGYFELGYLIAATYSGRERAAVLKFYDPKTKRVWKYVDKTGHKPYCYAKVGPAELLKIRELVEHPGFEELQQEQLYDPLEDRLITVTKIIARDPVAIGGGETAPHPVGRPRTPIRDILKQHNITAYEANIKYHDCYLFDRGFIPMMPYTYREGDRVPKPVSTVSTDRFSDFFYRVRAESPLHHQFLNRWLRTLSEPLPEIPIAAMDIEVRCPSVGHIPDPREADEPVICVCFVCSDGRKCAFLLLRSEVGDQVPEVAGVEVFTYRDERELLKAVFEFIIKYPVLVTFNGDDFDLRYLWHRAVDRFGFRREETPFEAHHDWMGVRHGIHIDLYPFFDNRSIQNYAYEQRYRETTLDDLAQALLNKRKIELKKPIGELDYKTLIEYCMNDAQLTYELAIKLRALELLFLISRIVITPPENVCRTGISIWIKNLLYASMRRLHPRYLIPHPEEVRKRGTITTRPVIKDKLYRGGFVKEPVPGVHFDVVVLDFASLYPSVISVWNISFDTVLCPHSECRDNLIPGTPHHVCRKRTGIVSAVIGSLKDVRVEYFKKLAKDKRLSPEERAFYNSVQLTMKVILNASYGVFGLRAFPLFCPPVAEGTAAVGRYALTKTIEKAESLGVRVLYGDTDSVFLHRPTEEQIHELIKWSERELKLKLELDKRYRYVVLPALKKNYIGVYDDGTVEVKGLAGKKRHMPAFIKRVFVEALETLSKVKTPEDFVDARNHIIHIVSEAHRKLRRREFDVRDLALVVKLGKDISEYRKTTPQHVKAARMLERLGRKVRRGDLIAFVKTRRGGAMPIDLARPEDVDIDKYAELLENTFRPILAALDLEVAEVTGGKMRSLFEFS